MGSAHLYLGYSGRKPEAFARDLGRALGGSEISAGNGFMTVSGTFDAGDYVAAAVIPETSGTSFLFSSDQRETILRLRRNGLHIRPVLFNWSLQPTSTLEWLVDSSRWPEGFMMQGSVFRDRKSNSYIEQGYNGNTERAISINNLAKANFPGFALLATDFKLSPEVQKSIPVNDMILEWNGHIVAEVPDSLSEKQTTEAAAAAYTTLKNALHFELVPFSLNRLKQAGIGSGVFELYAAYSWDGKVQGMTYRYRAARKEVA